MSFVIAIILLLIGHSLRMLRTFLLLNRYIDKPIKPFWLSLGVGYLIDFFMPIRISDIFRTFTFSRLTKTVWGLSLAVVIFERLFDTFLIFLLFLFFSHFSIFSIILFVLILCFITLCPFTLVRKPYLFFASILNDRLKRSLLAIYWCVYRIRKELLKNKVLFISVFFSSVAMMAFYIISLHFLTDFIKGQSLFNFIQYQFSGIGSSGIWNINKILSGVNKYYYSIYLLIPVILAIIISFIPMKITFKKKVKIIPFLYSDDALKFLTNFMQNGHTTSDEHYYNMTHSSRIVKDLSAASEAKTFLMKQGDKLLIRKIALDNACKKLEEQFYWLVENKTLPLPKIYTNYKYDNIFAYDMEYFAGGENFFTMIHILPVEKSFDIIKNIIDTMKSSYKKLDLNIREYTDLFFTQKVIDNKKIIITDNVLNSICKYKTLIVNNCEVPNAINDSAIEFMSKYNQSIEYPIFGIHGDLTIENILVNKNAEAMIIDPSPYKINIFCEYAKLFQSLHGKYEYVKNIDNFFIEDKKIEYPQYATVQYEDLFTSLKNYIIKHYGESGLKCTYFYEAICHIRTASYMIKLKRARKAILMIALASNALKECQNIEV